MTDAIEPHQDAITAAKVGSAVQIGRQRAQTQPTSPLERPIGLGVLPVAVSLPCGDFLVQDLLVGDAAVETLGGQNAEFGFRHVQPTAVFWCVVPLEPFDEPTCLGGGERLRTAMLACAC